MFLLFFLYFFCLAAALLTNISLSKTTNSIPTQLNSFVNEKKIQKNQKEMNSQGLNSSYNEEFGLPATQMVDDGEDESQQSLHNDPKVWGRMVALMRGLDFVCFTKNEYARLLFFSFQNVQHKF